MSMQVVSVKQTDLEVSLKAMYHILRKKAPFDHYNRDVQFLSMLGLTSSDKKSRNATLTSERMKSELIQIIGMKTEII